MIDSIIFNLGGTLIDETNSYRKVIELTVNNFVGKNLITTEDVRKIKSIPGFPNDWDMSFVFIKMFEDGVPKEQWHLEAPSYLPVNRKSDEFLKVYDYFQTFFLGASLYKELEGGIAPIPYDPGMITATRSLVNKELLVKISRKFKISIFTECPKNEVEIMLKSAGIWELFEGKIVAQEDVNCSRPDPEGLWKAQELMNAKNPIYLGDDGSDFLVAQNADMAFGFVGSREVKTEDFLRGLL